MLVGGICTGEEDRCCRCLPTLVSMGGNIGFADRGDAVWTAVVGVVVDASDDEPPLLFAVMMGFGNCRCRLSMWNVSAKLGR